MKIQRASEGGFTMVELMIVVGIIAVIAGIAVPMWMRARENAQRAKLINELRTTSEAFNVYVAEHNQLPPTAAFQVVPDGMAQYMPKNSGWTDQPAGGGYMCWLNYGTNFRGYTAFIGVYGSGLSPASIQQMDEIVDDGDLSTGGLIYMGGDPSGNGSDSWIFYGVQGAQ